MLLNFMGTGSGFSNEHNNAYFWVYDGIVFLDLSILNMSKAIQLAKEMENVYLLLTHMHDDHAGGMGLFAQYLYYSMGGKELQVLVPPELYDDVIQEMRIKDVDPHIYKVFKIPYGMDGKIQINENHPCHGWLQSVIPTFHTPGLTGKSFGYRFWINGNSIVYSGDTCRLKDFYDGQALSQLNDVAEFYVDCSLHYGKVHLKWDEVKDELKDIANAICDVYLMHLDDREGFEKMDLGKIKLAKSR